MVPPPNQADLPLGWMVMLLSCHILIWMPLNVPRLADMPWPPLRARKSILLALQYWTLGSVSAGKIDQSLWRDGGDRSYDFCNIGFTSRLDYDFDVRLRRFRPSGSDIIELTIIRPEDQSSVGDLATELLLDLCTGQVTTGDRVFLKISGDAGTSCEATEQPKATKYRKHGSLHCEICLGDQPCRRIRTVVNRGSLTQVFTGHRGVSEPFTI